jgi:hypothetical protein
MSQCIHATSATSESTGCRYHHDAAKRTINPWRQDPRSIAVPVAHISQLTLLEVPNQQVESKVVFCIQTLQFDTYVLRKQGGELRHLTCNLIAYQTNQCFNVVGAFLVKVV